MKLTPAFYRPSLDGLRFLAFAAVFFHHAMPGAPAYYAEKGLHERWAAMAAATARAGAFGVDLFFVLSSYLITTLLLLEFDRWGRIRVRDFWARRVLRIWPLFFAFLVIAYFMDRWVFMLPGISAREALAFVFFLGNWACVFGGYPASVAALLWSVAIEEQFYLVWPAVVGIVGRKNVPLVGAALIVVGVVSRWMTASSGLPNPAVWCSTLCRLDTIGLGVLLAVYLIARPPWRATWWPLATMIGMAFVWVAVELAFPVAEQRREHVFFSYLLVDLAATAIVLSALSLDGMVGTILSSRVFVYLGKISYGLYVFHVLGLELGRIVWDRFVPRGLGLLHVFVGFLLTVGFAGTSYALLERPFLRMKERFTVVQSRT